MDATFKRLTRRQLSHALDRYAKVTEIPQPRDGWIAALRQALDMTVGQFAARLGVVPSNVVRLEQRERDDNISLAALRRAADALGCDLVYAVIPRFAAASKPGDNVLDALIEARAREVAVAQLSRVAHTMALEDQEVSAADLEAQITERAAALAQTPRRLWDPEVMSRATQRSTSRRGRPA